MAMLRLADGESGSLITPLTVQHLQYVGGAGLTPGDAAPDFNSFIGPNVVHYINNTDHLTLALAKIGYAFTNRLGDSIFGTLTWQSGAAATFANGASVTFQNGVVPAFQQATGVAPFTVASTTKVTNLNADLLDDLTSGNGNGNIPINNGVLNTNLNADLLDGLNSGNGSGNIPISNGTVNTNLNADMVDGQHASAFLTALPSHTHEIEYSGITYDSWGAIYTLSGPDGAFDFSAWKMSRDGTVDGKIYFYESGADYYYGSGIWTLFHNVTGTVQIWDDDTGNTVQTISSIASVGGGEYEITFSGAPNLTAYTTAQNARFRFTAVNIWKRTIAPATSNNVHHFRIHWSLDSGTYRLLQLYQDGFASDDIAMATLTGIGWRAGGFDGDDAIFLQQPNWDSGSGGRWRVSVFNDQNANDGFFTDIQLLIIPRTTSTP